MTLNSPNWTIECDVNIASCKHVDLADLKDKAAGVNQSLCGVWPRQQFTDFGGMTGLVKRGTIDPVSDSMALFHCAHSILIRYTPCVCTVQSVHTAVLYYVYFIFCWLLPSSKQ